MNLPLLQIKQYKKSQQKVELQSKYSKKKNQEHCHIMYDNQLNFNNSNSIELSGDIFFIF